MLITSFSRKGWQSYGRRFLASYQDTKQTLPLWIYHEFNQPEMPVVPGVTWLPLEDTPSFRPVEERMAANPEMCGIVKDPQGVESYNYRFDAHKFFRKVFAINHAYQNAPKGETSMVWVDADVEFIRPVPQSLQRILFPRGETVCHLDRINMYSECGFVGVNLQNEQSARRFMMTYWGLYSTGAFSHLREWHDCMVLDHARIVSAVHSYSLSGDRCTDLYPWDLSILSDWMVHHKGPERKDKAYKEAA